VDVAMKARRIYLPEIIATASFVLLVAAALTGFSRWFAAALLTGIIFPVVLFRRLFPEAGLFTLVLANLLAVYACLYIYFIQANFVPVNPWPEATAFLLPIIGFVVGCVGKKKRIRHLAETRRKVRRQDLIGLAWLIPILTIGAFTFALPDLIAENWRGVALLASMCIISVLVLRHAEEIALFLLETGELFEIFIGNLARMAVPVFAFFSVYSLLIIVFAALFSLVDRIQPGPQFSVSGVQRQITFAESLYFSVSTVATIGYGDILPIDDSVRMLAAVEVITGILLLLFGFAELLRADRRGGEP
jgi:voltage-gated potassium channel